MGLGVPICIALIVCLASALKQIAPSDLIEANHAATMEISRMNLHWHSLSVRERRSCQTRRSLISRIEKVMLAVASNAGRPPVGLEEDSEERSRPDADLRLPSPSRVDPPFSRSSAAS